MNDFITGLVVGAALVIAGWGLWTHSPWGFVALALIVFAAFILWD